MTARAFRRRANSSKVNAPAVLGDTAQWDLVYGPGFFVGHVLGTSSSRASLTRNQGTTLAVEFYKPGQGDVTSIKGIAQDNKATSSS